ncbi:RNase A-like domain-containing protein [Methylocystis sp. JAN1]|uniref:RNase A-like domain-containing protein n=1 Tax=Methylocystis sp. JAN1 TaxID=3397211 RepID=UPI003FA31241
MLPLVVRVQKSFQAWLRPGFSDFRLDYNADRLEALAAERAAEWERVGKADFLTLDEQREAVGYGPAPKDAAFGKGGARDLERRYSPNQPRVPAGSGRESGQWAAGGGAAGTNVAQTQSGDRFPTTQADNSENYSIDVLAEEADAAHVKEKHIAKTDQFLKDRVRQGRFSIGPITAAPRAGSFLSLTSAEKLINSTIAANRAIIEQLVSGALGEGKTIRIDRFFNSITGKEAFAPSPRGEPEILATRWVAVVLRHDRRSPRGFKLITAFPFNE